jgi:hypothetical protein
MKANSPLRASVPPCEKRPSSLPPLPCPFCGGKPTVLKTGGLHEISCYNPKCRVMPMAIDENPALTLALWNTRKGEVAHGISESALRHTAMVVGRIARVNLMRALTIKESDAEIYAYLKSICAPTAAPSDGVKENLL